MMSGIVAEEGVHVLHDDDRRRVHIVDCAVERVVAQTRGDEADLVHAASQVGRHRRDERRLAGAGRTVQEVAASKRDSRVSSALKSSRSALSSWNTFVSRMMESNVLHSEINLTCQSLIL